jgi:mannosylglycoprotein endo-beta-mannosidase
MRESDKADVPQLSTEETNILSADFTEQEVYDAIMQMENNKAPGPDGFPAEFYQTLWNVIKVDLMRMFEDFQNGELPLFRLNFGTIILLPKKRKCNTNPTISIYLSSKCKLQDIY